MTLAIFFGRRVNSIFLYAWELLLLFYFSLRSAILSREQSFRAQLAVIAQQVYYTGFQGLPAILLLGIGVGFLMVVQAMSGLNLIGSNNMLGQMFVAVVMREVAPLLTVLIVIARSGTAVATEIGNMKVNREVEALEVMGIHPLVYIVAPRIIAGTISVLCLSLYFLFAAFITGMLVSLLLYEAPMGYYSNSIFLALGADDVVLFAAKILLSGALVFSVCCYRGLKVNKASYEVPQATTAAVVDSVMLVVCCHMLLTVFSYAHKLQALGVL